MYMGAKVDTIWAHGLLGLGSACHGLRLWTRKLEHGDPMRSYHGLHVPLYVTGAF